jgi:RNA polymerase sigma factor for flagellar operon FliA
VAPDRLGPDELVQANLGLPFKIARRITSHFGWCDIEDLEQAGLEALVKSSRRFDPSRGVSFATFASHRIRGAMLDETRLQSFRTRREREQGVERERPASLDEFPILEPGEDDRGYELVELNGCFDEAIAELPERERFVVVLHEFQDVQLRKIGELLGVTESRVSQLYTKALSRLREQAGVAA